MDYANNLKKIRRSMYASIATAFSSGFGTCGALERLMEGDYKSAACIGLATLGCAVYGISKGREAAKMMADNVPANPEAGSNAVDAQSVKSD